MKALTDLGIDLKGKTSGQYKTTCPQCSHTRKKKNDTCLSVDITSGVYHCFNCEWKGTTIKRQIEKKEYTLPTKNLTELSQKALDWFKGRGIGQSTIMSFRISEGLEFMPQVNSEVNCIQFPYFKDEKLVNIKYRDAKKNFKQFKGAEPIFFNLKAFDLFEEIIITEGEMDALSFYEAGVLNVVSVPAGATDSETATLEYLNTCYDYLKGKKFIIATDNDPKGIAFRNVLASRLGKDICRYIQFPDGIKDANELLVKVGRDSFTANYAIRIFPLEGIETVQDVEQDLDQLFVHGYPVGAQVGYSTFDKHLSFFLGHVGVYTGIPGHGKSELTDQLLVNLSERSGWKHAVFSAENQPLPYHLIKLAEKYTKKAFRGTGAMSIDEYAYAKYWLSEHFFFIKFSEVNLRLESILDKARELILRHGVSNLIIDNWANLEHAYEGETEHQYIGKSLIKVMNFARMYNVHVMLVAHPTKVFKSKETGLYEVPNLYSISGSSHWFNKPDYGITVYRNMENNETSVHIQKCRWKYAGKVGAAVFTWNPYNGIYNEIL